MSEHNVEVVERAVAAVNARDLDGYLACCTEDVELWTPLAEITGVYEGRDGIERFFADIEDAGPDFRIDLERVEVIGGDRVLAFLRVTSTGRASGIPTAVDTPTGNVYDLAAGKIRRLRIFLDRQEALEAVGLRE
jgi:ketosteroid isomerase-like protein